MDLSELAERLKSGEWNDIEFKKSQKGVSESAYETVSAFSNTAGGYLVFGVKDTNGNYDIVGVLEVDKVQNEFLSTLRTGDKLNRIITTKENIVKSDDGKTLLIFYIPEAHRQEKPVYLKGDIRQSYIRRDACDERCTKTEIERFLREASSEHYGAQSLDFDPEDCFDADALKWYRAIFESRNPEGDSSMSDLEFLHHWGLINETRDQLLPTRASILLFGNDAVFRQILRRPVVACQWINASECGPPPDQRWADRLLVERNLIHGWRSLLDWYMKYAERPFNVDPATLQREDLPPDHIAFRETAINLLIHQDYADHTRKPEILFYRDGTVFWNPGDAFASSTELLEPGEKEVRNPRIVSAFRRIGFSEQAGSGIRYIFLNWQRLGHVPPTITNNKEKKTFELKLLKEILLSEEQLLFQASLGVHLSEDEARVFAYACRKGIASLQEVRIIAGASVRDAKKILDRLQTQALIFQSDQNQEYFHLAKHLQEHFKNKKLDSEQLETIQSDLSTAQVEALEAVKSTEQVQPLNKINDIQWEIIRLCDVPKPLTDIMSACGKTHRGFFMRNYLNPMITGGIIQLTNPDKPRASNQKYVLTKTGLELNVQKMANETAQKG